MRIKWAEPVTWSPVTAQYIKHREEIKARYEAQHLEAAHPRGGECECKADHIFNQATHDAMIAKRQERVRQRLRKEGLKLVARDADGWEVWE